MFDQALAAVWQQIFINATHAPVLTTGKNNAADILHVFIVLSLE
jgi:hypothetical protein